LKKGYVDPGWDGLVEAALVALAIFLFALICVAIPAVLFGGFLRNSVERHEADDGMNRSLKSSLAWLVLAQMCAGASFAGARHWRYESVAMLLLGLAGAIVAANLMIANGGFDVIAHLVLRRMLARHEGIPRRLRQYLDAGTATVLLQSVGGSYRFVHVLLRDVLAEEASLADGGPAGSGRFRRAIREPDGRARDIRESSVPVGWAE
jgi:hypothetical protein